MVVWEEHEVEAADKRKYNKAQGSAEQSRSAEEVNTPVPERKVSLESEEENHNKQILAGWVSRSTGVRESATRFTIARKESSP